MNRKIKFRAWDIKNKRFVNIIRFVFDQFGSLDYAEVVFRGKIYKLYPSEIVLEQDTGLKDKNGKEICEGDIIDYIGECTCVIQYEDEGARFIYRDISDDFPFGFNGLEAYNGKLYEVIGNIHENPELLGVE